MSDPFPAPPEPNAFRLSVLYAVVFVEIGIAMPFMPVWLNALGLEAGIIGALLALPIAVKIVATAPLVYDRQQDIRGLLIERAQETGSIDPADFAQENWRLVADGEPLFN